MSMQARGEMRQFDRNLQHLRRHLAFRRLGASRQRDERQQGGGERHAIKQRASLFEAHGATLSAEPRDPAGWNIGMRSIALYQSIIRAVRHIIAIPAMLTASCIATPES